MATTDEFARKYVEFELEDATTQLQLAAKIAEMTFVLNANATPLAAPAAPVPTTATTGGTIAAGIYQVQVTYVNRWGETVASASGSVTTTGTTSTITIPAPVASGEAVAWYAYVTQVGGNTYTRQQAAGVPTAMGTALTLIAPPTNTGANPPASDSSANVPSLSSFATGTVLSNAQTGNGDSTTVFDFGNDDNENVREAAFVRVTSVVGATPTCTYSIMGSVDGVTYTALKIADSATPATYGTATWTETTFVTRVKLVKAGQTWRYLKVVYSLNTNVTNHADVLPLGD